MNSSTIRSIISIVFSLILLIVSFLLAQKIAGKQKTQEAIFEKDKQMVFVDTVVNEDVAVQINATGNLQAQQRIEIFAEVQGVFKKGSNPFKPGQYYSSGSTLIYIENDEYSSSLQAARSNLYNQIVAAIPDLKLDYPQQAAKWENYLQNFNPSSKLKSLPSFDTDQEKYFINSRGIINSFFQVQNMEERLEKYVISAPFSGVLTEALVSEGALVRAGQKLGEFIDPSVYELELSINQSYQDLLKVGNSVELQNLDGSKTYKGIVKRLNKVVNPNTQSVQAYVEVRGENLSEGMYLSAVLQGRNEQNVYEIPRKLLIDNQKLYTLQDSILQLITVNPVYFTEETALIKGLPNGTLVISKLVPGAYNGMVVQLSKTSN